MSIIIKCIRGSGDKEAEPITDSLIVTENMAVLRGKRFLDDPSQGSYYNTVKRTLKAPHLVSGETSSGHVEPRSWISVTDGHLGLSSTKLKIKAYTITIEPDGIWGAIEAEEYREP